jgi:hypothetical protein
LGGGAGGGEKRLGYECHLQGIAAYPDIENDSIYSIHFHKIIGLTAPSSGANRGASKSAQKTTTLGEAKR